MPLIPGFDAGNFPTGVSIPSSSGNYTPGAKFDIDTIQAIGNWCGRVAAWCATNIDGSIDDAVAALGAPPAMAASQANPLPNIQRPKVFIPEIAQESDVIQIGQMTRDMIDKLLPIYNDFFSRWFPLYNATVAKAELWIQGVISGGAGLPSAIEDAIWERERARGALLRQRAEADASALWAGRGFPLPPGMLAGAIQNTREEAQRNLSASSREIAIEKYRQEIDLVKFAVEQALKLRQMAMDAANGYIDALVSSVVKAGDFFEKKNDGQQKLIAAVADWWRADANAEEIMWKARLSGAEMSQDASKANLGLNAEYAKIQAEMVAQKADAVAKLAAAAVNNLQLSASVGYSTRLDG